MANCPFCEREIQTANRVTGDIVLCPCDAQLLVRHQSGGTVLITMQAPPVVVKRRQRRRKGAGNA